MGRSNPSHAFLHKPIGAVMKRSAGILMHISSLPGPYGIGTFGKEAYRLIDFLELAGQSRWQVLPLGPTSYGDSPYQSFSSFAINPYFIDLDILIGEGWLEQDEVLAQDFGDEPLSVDFEKIFQNRFQLFQKAFDRSKESRAEQDQLEWFMLEQHEWLQDYALYMTLKVKHELKEWGLWDEELRLRDQGALDQILLEEGESISFWCWLQYKGYSQWAKLKQYANDRGILVIGDIPIYAAYDSADAWANASSGIFKLDESGRPLAVAGCPPDYFAVDGQYWGNPVYDWDKCRLTDYDWWMQRVRNSFNLFDIVRIDHFRGLESYWEIPYGSPTAAYGHWTQGPGMDFVDALQSNCGCMEIIAEDLGLMTEQFYHFQKECEFPGMKVLQFAFDGSEQSGHLPHYHVNNSVVYTGTHDNDTMLGWMEKANEHDRKFAMQYLRLDQTEGYHWGFVRGAWASVADLAVAPMQDLLGLGSEARMNTPAVLGGQNWKWRAAEGYLSDQLAERLKDLTRLYGRL